MPKSITNRHHHMQKQIVPPPPNHARGVRIKAATSGDAISFPFTTRPSV